MLDKQTASNLPVELLQPIFSYYSELKKLSVGLYHACPAWIAVTHVCRRWRAAALNYPSLWTLINTDTLANPSLIDVTFRMIYLSGGMSGLRLDVLFALFAGCTRLRSPHIIGETSIVCKLLDTLHSATPVRSLCLDIADRRPVTSVEHPDDLLT